jgi:hypothetical protein
MERATVGDKLDQPSESIAMLRDAAWALCNAGYDAPDPHLYRSAGQVLYRKAFQEGVMTLFARLDAQNRRLDALLGTQTQS